MKQEHIRIKRKEKFFENSKSFSTLNSTINCPLLAFSLLKLIEINFLKGFIFTPFAGMELATKAV